MGSKMMRLAVGAIMAFAFAALPAIASAGEPQIDPVSGKFPLTFTSTGGASQLRAEGQSTISCKKNKGTGKYTNATTGEIELTFEECSEPVFGTACTSPGAASGSITTGTSVFHNTYLTDNKTTPGVLVTPPASGVFATFTCFFGAIHVEVTGNGIMGHLSAPKCGAKSKTATLEFGATGASQTFKQITGTGTAFDLKSFVNGSGPFTAAEIAEGTVSFAEEATLTCV